MINRKFLTSMTFLIAALATENALAITDASNKVSLAPLTQDPNNVETNKGINQFNFILKATTSPQFLMAGHGSHSSHSSHSSHRSHYSGY